MSKVSQDRTAGLSLVQAALPVKDAMRLVRDNLRRGNRMVRDNYSHRLFPPIPQMVALAADEMIEIAESVVRRIAPGDRLGARLKAFPLSVDVYFGGDGSDMASRRRLFVATHYAVAKHLLRETDLLRETRDEAACEALFVCETAIDSAWHRLQPTRARVVDEIAQVAAVTLALLHHRPIRKVPLAKSGMALEHDPNLIVFATAGLATATTAFARPGAPVGYELLGLASDVVRARIGSFEAALAASDPHRELWRVYSEFAPILS